MSPRAARQWIVRDSPSSPSRRPGAPNPAAVGTSNFTTLNLTLGNHSWRYYQNAATAPADDSLGRDFTHPPKTTPRRARLGDRRPGLYIESSAFPAAVTGEGVTKTTLLTGFTATRPWQTYYFRTHFNYTGALPGPTVNVTLSAKVLCDDGCVIYLNGQRVQALRVTDNPATFASQTTGTSPEVTLETITIPTTYLQSGDNVLAVSVHQSDTQLAGSAAAISPGR
jgi:hypothetical protein